jgi:hypothetical protein
VNATEHQFRGTADEALVSIAPLDELRVARRLLFDLRVCGKLHFIQSTRNWECNINISALFFRYESYHH